MYSSFPVELWCKVQIMTSSLEIMENEIEKKIESETEAGCRKAAYRSSSILGFPTLMIIRVAIVAFRF